MPDTRIVEYNANINREFIEICKPLFRHFGSRTVEKYIENLKVKSGGYSTSNLIEIFSKSMLNDVLDDSERSVGS